MITMDTDGFKWEDERLKQPEHFTAEKDGFTISIAADATMPDRWFWGVTRMRFVADVDARNATASGPATRKETAIAYAKEAVALLKRALAENT